MRSQADRHWCRFHALFNIADECFAGSHFVAVFGSVVNDLRGDNLLQEAKELVCSLDSVGFLVEGQAFLSMSEASPNSYLPTVSEEVAGLHVSPGC